MKKISFLFSFLLVINSLFSQVLEPPIIHAEFPNLEISVKKQSELNFSIFFRLRGVSYWHNGDLSSIKQYEINKEGDVLTEIETIQDAKISLYSNLRTGDYFSYEAVYKNQTESGILDKINVQSYEIVGSQFKFTITKDGKGIWVQKLGLATVVERPVYYKIEKKTKERFWFNKGEMLYLDYENKKYGYEHIHRLGESNNLLTTGYYK